jgi:hypothetical protein
VFAFGSVYAVAQFYFILQVPITRIDLSIIVNATVFAAGIFTMIFLIRRHLASVELNAYKAKMAGPGLGVPSAEAAKPRRSIFRLPWKRASKVPEPQTEKVEEATTPSQQAAEPDEAPAEPGETIEEPAQEGVEPDDQDY